jgi:uncharacterized protein (TIGR01777 family)
MRVLVAGSSGLIGNALVARLRDGGHEVVRLVRRRPQAADERGWDPPSGRVDPGAFDGVAAVVNLCGAPLAPGRWSAARKQLLTDSRVEPSEVLAEAVAEHGIGVLVNASGIYYYGDTDAREVDESSRNGPGFLAALCARWEAATAPAAGAGARVVLLRTAPVLAARGGLLMPLARLFRVGLGSVLGNGTQYLPWIGIRDHVAATLFLLEHPELSGPVNITAPHPATNVEFSRALGRVLHRPVPWRVPGTALRAMLGEAADDMVLSGPRALPRALIGAGFRFTLPDLDAALAAAL